MISQQEGHKPTSYIGTYLLMFFLLILAVLSGYNYFYQPFADLSPVVNDQTQLTETVTEPQVEVNTVDLVFSSLSPESKIALLLAQPADLSSGLEFSSLDTGYITIFGSDLDKERVSFFINQLKQQRSSSQLKLGVLVDHEGGGVQRLSGEGFTKLPSWKAICESSIEEGLSLFSISAQELFDVGITHVLGPVVDVGGSKVLGERVCSETPETVVAASESLMRAYSQVGIIPVIKHFPGLGSTTIDLHDNFESITITEKDTQTFKKLLSEFSNAAVMVSHVGVKNQGGELPCSFSPDCINELASVYPLTLRFSDALDMESALSHATASAGLSDISDAARQAIEAGNDVLVFGPSYGADAIAMIKRELTQHYQEDVVFKEKVDLSAKRVIQSKLH